MVWKEASWTGRHWESLYLHWDHHLCQSIISGYLLPESSCYPYPSITMVTKSSLTILEPYWRPRYPSFDFSVAYLAGRSQAFPLSCHLRWEGNSTPALHYQTNCRSTTSVAICQARHKITTSEKGLPSPLYCCYLALPYFKLLYCQSCPLHSCHRAGATLIVSISLLESTKIHFLWSHYLSTYGCSSFWGRLTQDSH